VLSLLLIDAIPIEEALAAHRFFVRGWEASATVSVRQQERRKAAANYCYSCCCCCCWCGGGAAAGGSLLPGENEVADITYCDCSKLLMLVCTQRLLAHGRRNTSQVEVRKITGHTKPPWSSHT